MKRILRKLPDELELTRFRGHLMCSSLRAEVYHGQRTEQGETAATCAAHIQ